jgi:hypothetical protein
VSRRGRHVVGVVSVLVTAMTAAIAGFGTFGPSVADDESERAVVSVTPGSVTTHTRTFDVSRVPIAVELGVLFDRSASTGERDVLYRQLVDQVINQLAGEVSAVSLNVAAAGFSDFPVFPYGTPDDVAYQRELAFGTDPGAWHDVMNAGGGGQGSGGGDGPESQLAAVGAAVAVDGESLGYSPSGTAKFLLVPADHQFHVPGDGTCIGVVGCAGDYPGPSLAAVEAMAAAAGVHIVGVATGRPNDDLIHLATATNGVVVAWPQTDDLGGRASEITAAILGRAGATDIEVTDPVVTGCEGVGIAVDRDQPSPRIGSSLLITETVTATEQSTPGLRRCTVDYGQLGVFTMDVEVTDTTPNCATDTGCVTTIEPTTLSQPSTTTTTSNDATTSTVPATEPTTTTAASTEPTGTDVAPAG